MDKNTSLKFGQMVKCPSKQCGKVYSFIRCSKCEKLIFSKDNENILGMAVKCPHQGCDAYTLVSHCPKCDTKAIYSDVRTNYKEGDLIQCPNPACDKQYPFQKNQEIYKDNLQILEQIEGEVINFGVAQVDENFLYKEDLLFNKRTVRNRILFPTQYSSESIRGSKSNFSESYPECMICCNNRKESVFYPCGHRCTCYSCGVRFFSVFKKCPKCHEKAKCIIKKIYD